MLTRYYMSNTFFNKQSTDQQVIMKDERFSNLEFDPDSDYELHVSRFSVNTDRIPTYIPRIEKPLNSIFTDENQNLLPGFLENPEIFDQLLALSIFPTRLQVMLEWTKSDDLSDERDRRHGEYVIWSPIDNSLPKPLVSQLSVKESYRNPYFHCYTQYHLLQLVANALSVCFTKMAEDLGITFTGHVQFDTYDKVITLLIPKEFYQNDVDKRFTIIVNYEFNQLFGFVYSRNPSNEMSYFLQHDAIDEVTLGLDAIPYMKIMTTRKITSFFPYKKIVFKSLSVGVRALKKNNSAQPLENASENILTDLLLAVNDITEFYDLIVYQPVTLVRGIDILTANFRKDTEIQVFLESADGYQSPLLVGPEGACELFFQIREKQKTETFF